MATTATTELTCPYPGLRPFRQEEAYLFFGRDEQRNQLLRKLNDRNFVAVVGTSGCGKSSLIRAGLIPDLKLGLLGPGRVQWQVAVMRPGDRPMDNLSQALLDDEALGTILPAALLGEGLRRGPLSLVELVWGSRPDGSPVLAPRQNLLLVVDQFEEIFRFRKAAEPAKDRSAGPDRDRIAAEDPERARNRERIRAEADAFVALILQSVRRSGPGKASPGPADSDGPRDRFGPGAADGGPGSAPPALGQGGPPLFVILTMRSDFLGDCAVFPGLPELLSDSQFLTPRLSRPQRREAIEGPAKVEGGQVEPVLINRLLNDMGAAPDQLPLMQHALMRLWLEAEKSTPHDADGDATAPTVLKLSDYEAMNGMAGALDLDATRAYNALDPGSRRIAEVMFRVLSERGDGRIDTRRLARVGEVARVAAVPEAAVLTVAEWFRTPDLNLLNLSGDVLDISHESVIRNWSLLRRWVEEEARSAEIYQQLRSEAQRFASDQRNHLEGDRLGPRMLEVALTWRGAASGPTAWRPSAAWAERYGPADDYHQVLDYIRLNEDEAQRERVRARRLKRLFQAIPIALLAALLVLLGVLAVRRIRSAEKEARAADSLARKGRARVEAIRALWNQLDEAGRVDPFSALSLARSLQANSGDGAWAQDDEVQEFLTRQKDELQRQHSLLASRTLAFGALNALSDGYPQQAVLLGVEAVNESQSVRGSKAEVALDALRQAIRGLGGEPLLGRDVNGRLIAHRQAVTGAVGSPDGRWVATSSNDGTVMVWDLVQPGRFLRLPHDAPVSGLCLAPNGRWLASFSSGRPAQVWDFQAGSPFDRPAPPPIPLAGDSPPQLYPTFSLDSRWLLLLGSDGGARLWDLRPPKPGSSPLRHDLRADGSWITVAGAISPDSRWLSLVKAGGEILLWALGAEGPEARAIPNQREVTATVNNVVFSEDSRRLAVTLIDGRLLVLDLGAEPNDRIQNLPLEVNETGEWVTQAEKARKFQRQIVASEHGGRWVIVERQRSGANAGANSAGGYVVWDLGAAGRTAIPYPLSGFPVWLGSQEINVFAGKHLVVRGQNGATWSWDLTGPAARAPRVFFGHISPVTAIVFDAEHKRIFTAASDGSVWAWDLEKDDPTGDASPRRPMVLRGHDRPVAAMVLAGERDAPVLITGSGDSEVRRWDLRDFPSRLTNEPQALRGRDGWNTVIVTPRGDWLAAATGLEPPQLRDLRSRDWRAPPLVLKGPAGPINSFFTSPDGRWLVANIATDPAAGPEAKATAWAWDLDAPDPTAGPLVLRGLEGYVATLRASRDGRWLGLTTIGDGRTGSLPTASYLRNLADGRPDPSPIKLPDHASTLEFSPDGRWLVLNDAGRVHVRRLSTKGPAPGQGHFLPGADVGAPPQISTDGAWLAAADRRGDLPLWRLDPAGAPPGRPHIIPGTGSIIREFRFDPAGRHVFMRDALGAVSIAPVGDRPGGGRRALSLAPVAARGAAISPDGRWFAWFGTDGGADRRVRLIDLSADADTPKARPLQFPPAGGEAADLNQAIVGLAFSREGRWLVAVGDGTGVAWDLAHPEADPTTFSGQGSSIVSVDVWHDRFLSIVAPDNNVQIWDLKREGLHRYPTVLRHNESATATNVIAPDGQYGITVVSGPDNVARTWRLSAEQLKRTAEETVGRNLTLAEWNQRLSWRQQKDATFPALPTPVDEPFTATVRSNRILAPP